MRIVITGVTGNTGTALVRALRRQGTEHEIVGIARRRPVREIPGVPIHTADVATDPLRHLFRGADAVVHLAWVIQPSRDEGELWRVNVEGSRRVFEAAAAAGVPALVHASSIGAYATAPAGTVVDESHPATGIPASWYSRHKARVEALLDAVEDAHPDLRVVRLRPGLIFQRRAAQEIRRYFAGPLLPNPLARPGVLPVLPLPRGLEVQAVHADDVAEAYALAATDGALRGAYNVAAPPVLDGATLGAHFGARVLTVPRSLVRPAVTASWRLRLQPTPAGWLDLGLDSPLMSTARLRATGWAPRRTSLEALDDLLRGMREGAGDATPPLDPQGGGPARLRELATGVGGRNP